MKIGVVASGGDAPGMNTVIASAVRYGTARGHEFIGFAKGWEGLLDSEYCKLEVEDIEEIEYQGGCFLGSSNRGRFNAKVGKGTVHELPEEIVSEIKDNFTELNLDCLLVIGGDGTITGANQMFHSGVPIVAIPKTIDNDLDDTDLTFGFDTAVETITESIDKLTTTAKSHERIFFVEVMGRHSGFLALHGGLAGGAHAILIPEMKLNIDNLVEFLRRRLGKYTIIVVAEGVQIRDMEQRKDDEYEVQLAGISAQLMNRVESKAPGEFDMRNTVLGHIQRGGSPSAKDRILSKIYATKAIAVIEHQEFGRMVALQDSHFVTIPLYEAVDKLKTVMPNNEVFAAAKKLGVYFGQ